MITRTTKFFKKHYLVISILSVSSALRWVLILRGGQFYFPDESRYGIAQDALVLLLDGKVKTALLTLLGELAHVGFKFTALIPAFFENKLSTTLALPAIFFSFFSILNLLLIWKIALATGASPRVANYALFIAASSQVLLYYSRHIFPYDEAMFFGLLALYVTLKNPNKSGISFLSGALTLSRNIQWLLGHCSLCTCREYILRGERKTLVFETINLSWVRFSHTICSFIITLLFGRERFSWRLRHISSKNHPGKF